MGDVLVYIEESAIDEGRAARLLGWARPLATASGGSLVALVASADAVTADRLPAADVVLHAQHPALSPYLPEAHQAVLGAAIAARTPDAVVLENTTSGWDLGAASAIGAGLPFVGSCEEVSISGATARTTSGVYAGQLAASTETPLPAVFGVTSTALHDEATPAGRGELETLPAPPALDSLRTTFVEAIVPSDEGVDLTKAELIVCVGRGIGGADNIPIAEELAEALGAELAASRPVIDSGWLPKVRQIGKSGAHVTPKLYLSLGVSGAPEHVEGMQGAELIVAVNKDPSAAIFNIAHYGVVADLFDIVDELTAAVGG
jgi:electron transfer flavoprotein alpha subunit